MMTVYRLVQLCCSPSYFEIWRRDKLVLWFMRGYQTPKQILWMKTKHVKAYEFFGDTLIIEIEVFGNGKRDQKRRIRSEVK